ncbi:hypothetical protein Lesp02_19990 [Lentzea sp. NBRC 105346]|nr:hypothetical protein Lesp02_19990 [Lentzea sp. NBRC 105346]
MVSIVGADGVGKSTVTAALRERVPARLVDRWDIVGNQDYPTASCLVDDTRVVRSCAARMSSTPRLLFLVWASVMAITDNSSGWDPDSVLLLDGYWVKHAASEIAYGADPAWVEAVTAGLPPSDLVIYLRSDPETAWLRKGGDVLPYECGMDMSRSRESFLAHQREIHRVLDRWSARHGWVEIDARRPLDLVLDDVSACFEVVPG